MIRSDECVTNLPGFDIHETVESSTNGSPAEGRALVGPLQWFRLLVVPVEIRVEDGDVVRMRQTTQYLKTMVDWQ